MVLKRNKLNIRYEVRSENIPDTMLAVQKEWLLQFVESVLFAPTPIYIELFSLLNVQQTAGSLKSCRNKETLSHKHAKYCQKWRRHQYEQKKAT